METTNLTGAIHSSMYHQLQRRGYAAPVDMLMDIDVLSKTDYENWRWGNAECLERMCRVNLHELSKIMKIIRTYALENGLKPSRTFYGQWECRELRRLRFSKSGNVNIETAYATHYRYK